MRSQRKCVTSTTAERLSPGANEKYNEDGYNKIVIAAMASIAARAVVLICCSMIFK